MDSAASSNLSNSSRSNTVVSQEARKIQVPQGAQNTLVAAGLSQTQIDALASLVAQHKPELGRSQSQKHQHPSPLQVQQTQYYSPSNTSQPSTPQTLQGLQAFPGASVSNTQIPQQQVQQHQLQSSLLAQLQPPQQQVNGLLVNLLAQTLANAINPINNIQQQQQQQQQQSLQTNVVGQLLSGILGAAQPQIQHFDESVLNQPQPQHSQQQQVHDLSFQQQQQQLTASTANNSIISSKKNPIMFKNSHLDIGKNSNVPVVRTSTSSIDSSDSPIKTEKRGHAHDNESPKPDKPENESSETRSVKGTASVRFRQKKKQKELEMEKDLHNAKEKITELQARIDKLEMENKILHNLVVEKREQRDMDEVERIRKKARLEVKK